MGFFSSTPQEKFPWKNLTSLEEWKNILTDTSGDSNLVFKHSTRCGISSMAKKQFEKGWNQERGNATLWYLDLLNYREISNQIAEDTGVQHQSPQVVVLNNQEILFAGSHHEIDAREILTKLTK